MRRLLPSVLLLVCIATSPPALAQIAMPEGLAVSPFPVAQNPASYVTIPDGAGGIWAVFQGVDPHSGLYASHVRSDGSFAPGFNAASRRIARDSSQVNNVTLCNDGLGGAVIVWFGTHPKDASATLIALRMVHLTYEGLYATRDTGIVVSTIATAASCAGDGNGGAYVVWEELKGTSNPDIVAQHYDFNGLATWTPSGSPTGRNVCATVGIQRLRAMHSDGIEGAYVVWADSRTPSTTPLYAMHLTLIGVDSGAWTTNGVRLTPVTSSIRFVGSGVSPTGSLWLAWRDFNVATQTLGQSLALNASFEWGPSGAILATVSPLHVDFSPASNGDALVTWGGNDVRCARINSAGARVWIESAGRILVTPPVATDVVRVAEDGAGGMRLLWSWDNAGQTDTYALHVNGAGTPLPGEDPAGTPVENGTANELAVAWYAASEPWPIVAWLEDGVLRLRQLVSGTLDAGDPPALAKGLRLAAPTPNPSRAGQSPALRFSAPPGPLRLALFDAGGRRVFEHALHSTGGLQTVTLAEAAALPPGVYALRLESGHSAASQRLVRLR